MSDRFDLDFTRPTQRGAVIVPSDTEVFKATRGLYIGTAGAITVVHADDPTPILYLTTIAGYIYPWSVTKVLAAGTTAGDIRGQY
jgi:hypothetical protein